MDYCAQHPEQINKFAKTKAQVAEVKGVMMDNIEKVLFWCNVWVSWLRYRWTLCAGFIILESVFQRLQ